MTDFRQYVIRGGIEGRERLRLLSRVMHPTTTALLDRLGLRDGLTCLDVGCGGGDVTLDLAHRVAPHGRAVGIDIDETKLALARHEAQQQGVRNLEYRLCDTSDLVAASEFDVVHVRYLLTHLRDPADAIARFYQQLRPGGIVAVEDIDFSGYFTYPESSAFRRYQELYTAVVHKRGGDPNIGPKLPLLLSTGGFEEVNVCVVQPMALRGDVKLISPMTMESIADTVFEEGLATRDEIDMVVRSLYEFAANPRTLAGAARVVQVWGRRPSS